MNNLLRVICLTAVLAALSACGNKGDLVLAEAPPPVEATETPAGEVPVEVTPEAATSSDPATSPTLDSLDDTDADAGDTPPVGTDPVEPPAPIPAG